MYRASSPTCSATLVRKAITSCFTTASISSTRVASNAAFFFMLESADAGTIPSFAQASHARSSTFSQFLYLFSWDQTAAISGREYLSII
jgi:hypothetical protein